MFHLAQVCPHCGARRGGEAPAPEPKEATPAREPLHLSAEEARALLSTHPGAPERAHTLVDVARDVVLPRGGALELLTSLVAAPLTAASIFALALARLRERRGRREESLQGAALLAVPATSGLLAVLLWELDVAKWAWVALGVSFVAWAIRAVVRANADDGLH